MKPTITENDGRREIPAFVERETDRLDAPNVIITGRYNIITFIPQNLFEQFRRLANVYFLVLGIIAAVGEFTSYYETAVQAVGILTPVSAVVLISMIKDGVEDWKRHRTDKIVNARPARRVQRDGIVEDIGWKDLLPGDVVLLVNGEEVPADTVVIASGGIQGSICYVETAAIDGETNLKPRKPAILMDEHANVSAGGISISANKQNVSGRDLLRLQSVVATVEAPNEVIYSFNGSLIVNEEGKVREFTMTKDNLLLRGSVIRASEWVVGLVIYTGAETKLSLNSKKPPSKLSSVDRIVNRTLMIAMSCMLLVCVVSMISEIEWLSGNNGAHYLCLKKSSLNDRFIGGGGCTSGMPESILTVFTFATLYNNFVCISMYVSLEMVYLCQAYFISQDRTIYDASTDSPAECHSTGMCADLGQIQYVLSDKTGTLTKNCMKLRRISVTGRKYGAPIMLGGLMPATAAPPDSQHVPRRSSAFVKADRQEARKAGFGGQEFDFNLFRTSEGDIWLPLHELAAHANSSNSPDNLSASEAADEGYLAELANDSRLIADFLRVLVACNTVIIMPDSNGKSFVNTAIELASQMQAESPDEVALVIAAAEFGGQLLVQRQESSLLMRRTYQPARPTTLTNSVGSTVSDQPEGGIKMSLLPSESPFVEPNSAEEVVHILAINAFDSERKRMSVLVRVGQRILLLCKGADSSMLPLCKPGLYSSECTKHVDTFASTGLRTLVMAQKEVDAKAAETWLQGYSEASKLIVGRSEQLAQCARLMEQDLELLGAVGVEDELQDGVPQAISTLLSAGLNVWMITGDKAETALAISRQCSLLAADHTLIRLLNLSGEALRQRILDLHAYLNPQFGSKQASEASFALSIENDNDLEQPLRRSWGGKGSGRDSHGNKFASKQLSPKASVTDSTVGSLDSTRRPKVALVVDGLSLEALWLQEDLRQWFTEAVRNVPTVVACRVSPKQKAALVRMIKTGAGHPITLAIGDGANDVGMIHEARVGVGITGKEGRHAANSSDFAIGQFRYLVPLMLEHGRYNYIRCCKLVLYSFFKNLMLVSVLFYYCIYSGYSGTVPLDSIIFSGYNFYLGLPIIALGAMDLDVPKDQASRYAYLAYSTGRCAELLNLTNMLFWCCLAFLEGYILFVVSIRFMSGTNTFIGDKYFVTMNGPGLNTADGQGVGLFADGFLLYSCIVVAMNNKAIMMTHTRTYISWVVWMLSLMGFFLFTYVYGVSSTMDWFNVVPLAFQCGPYWLAVILVPIILLLLDMSIDTVMSLLLPSSQQKLKKIIHQNRKTEQLPSPGIRPGAGPDAMDSQHADGDEGLNARKVGFTVVNPVQAGRDAQVSDASVASTGRKSGSKTTLHIPPHIANISATASAAPSPASLPPRSSETDSQRASFGLLSHSFSDESPVKV